MSQQYEPAQQLPPSGWYPDPVDQTQERYWDGTSWTTRQRPQAVQPQPLPQQAAPQQQYGYQPRTDLQQQTGYPQQGYQPSGYVPQGYSQYQPAGYGPATADGVPLAGWWQRAWATIIDSLILGLATVGAALPFIDALATGMQAWVEDVVRAAQSGGIPPEYTDPQYGLAGPIMTIYLVSLIVSIIYSTGMLMWKGGTLGQMALGLRVVPVNAGAQQHGLRLGMSLIRSIAFYGLSAITIIGLINVLVPLGNRKRQALHDMIAKTQVVKIR